MVGGWEGERITLECMVEVGGQTVHSVFGLGGREDHYGVHG